MAVAMSVWPLTQTVTRLRPGGVVTDPFGNPVPGPPSDDQVLVFAWWIGSSGEPGVAGHVERVDSDATLFAPSGEFTASDQVELPGVGVFEVMGRPGNWDHNPWLVTGLEQVDLKLVEG